MRKFAVTGIPTNALVYLVLWVALWSIVFRTGLISAIDVWWTNDTYRHCFFVLPAVVYFSWRERAAALAAAPTLDYRALLPLLAALGLWAIGYAGSVQVFEHAALIAYVPLSFLLALGFPVLRAAWFASFFIFFAVPIGEELAPPFQSIAANIVLYLLNHAGIPVHRNGFYLTIPNGVFEIAQACSGVRFFVATIFFGVLYSYVTYTRWWKRLVFLLISAIVPVIANGVRAFGTVYVGYVSNMRYATGVDHLFYGWVFFVIVIVLLILLGEWWRDDVPRPKSVEPAAIAQGWRSYRYGRAFAVAAMPLLAAAAWSAVIDHSRHVADLRLDIAALQRAAYPASEQRRRNWAPQYAGADDVFRGVLKSTDVDIYIALYGTSRNDKKMITSTNYPFREREWTVAESRAQHLAGSGDISANLLDLRTAGGGKRLLVMWYVVDGYSGGSAILAKLHQALNLLIGRSGAGAVVAFSSVYGDSTTKSIDALLQVIERYREEVRRAVPIY